MKNRALSILLLFAVVVGLLPALSVGVKAATSYSIWVGGVEVTSDNAVNISGAGITGGTVTYNSGTNVLTLNGATITGYYADANSNSAGIYGTNDLIIILEGSNTINVASYFRAAGILSLNKGIALSGTGSLNITPSTTTEYSVGIRAYTNCSITGCTITATGGTTTGDSNAGSTGITAIGVLTIENATVIANGGSVASTSQYDRSCGIYAKSLTVSNSTVTAVGNTMAIRFPGGGSISLNSSSVLAGTSTSDTGATSVSDLSGYAGYKYVKIEPYVAPPTYTATVTVNKDGAAWTIGTPTITFGTTSATAVANGTSVVNGTYNIYANGSDTGEDVTVNGSTATVVINYYTLTLSAGAGTSSPSGGGFYLEGKSVPINVTVNSGYTWSKWASSNTGFLVDQATQSTSIVMPAAAITLTATATPIQNTITYTLNGGTLVSANPASYTVESSAITLNTPTRSDYTFVGWTGSNGTAAQTNVSIPTGSTGNKTYTANWKAYKPASAPDASIVTARTDSSLTITTQTGYEYSVDGTNWHSGTGSYTFTGLAQNKAYDLVCRKAAVTTGDISSASDASASLSVSTKMATASVPVPVAPTVGTGTDKPTSNSITVNTEAGSEYYISTSATADWSGTPNGYFKITVNGTHKFNSLNPATQYYIHVRVAETENAMPSASSSVSQYTLPETPKADVGYSISYATEKITVTGGYEVNTDADFGAGTAVANNATLTAGTTYYIRVAANGGVPTSEAVSFAIPVRPTAPTVITADKTNTSITVTTVAGQEYKIGSGDWQDSGIFTGLSAQIGYTVYSRVKATSTTFASNAITLSVTTKSTGNVTTPTLTAVTYAPGKALADITLPANWAWSAPTTVPTVANSGYSALYTPTDTATVDYSGVTGYAKTSGTVTITRIIALTVNRATPTAADFIYTAPASLGYDNTAKSAAATAKSGISGMGVVMVKYYQGSTEIATPISAGTYTVKIEVAQGDNYASTTNITDDTWTFDIGKVAQASLSITKKPASIIYGNTFTLYTTGGSGNGDIKWKVTSGSSADVNESTGVVTVTGVGETTITATKATDGNYTAEVTDTYTFTPAKRLIKVDAPSATGGWAKTYDGVVAFNKSNITVGNITNKVGSDAVNVSVQSAAYDTAAIGSGNKELTIIYAIDGANSGNYSASSNSVISDASITAASPTITLTNKTAVCTNKLIEIDAADVKGVTGGTTPDGAITYIYYTKGTYTDGDKTTVDKSGADTVGGAPKNVGTYYVKATIAASGNYTAATSAAVTLTIYYPSSGEDKSSAPVIVDGKTVDMGTSEVKDGTTTVKVDQIKMTEQLKSAKDSVVIPVTSKTDTAAAQLVVQNVEYMAKKGMTLTVQAEGVNYSLPATAVDTATLLKGLEASDSSKVTFTVTMTELSKTAVTIKDGTLMVAPIEFTVTAAYSGKSVTVESFESYVQRDIELPSGVDPKTVTTAVVVEANGTERHVPTEVYSKSGKWYAKINSMTNSTYALIQNNASFTDSTGKWYDAVVTEMASRRIVAGIGNGQFAGERAMTRAEFATIIVRALGLPENGKSPFADVSADAWYAGAVGTAFEHGIVSGKGDGIFDPSAYITREEAMVMVARAAKLCGMDTSITSGEAGLTGFEDAAQISLWANESAVFNVRNGLIKGSNGIINSRANITRAETATVVLRLLQKAELVDVRTIA